MNLITKEEIIHVAENLNRTKKEWHFHLLTPDCLLNTTKQFALVLEDKDNEQVYMYTSDEKPMDTSETLLRLLHGNQIMDEKKDTSVLSPKVTHMMERAHELNTRGFFWHHHVLFPYCTYNKHLGEWTIIFEDPEEKSMLESVSDEEPKADMNIIEPAFYHQNIQK